MKIILALAFIMSTTQAMACICLSPEPIDSAYKRASTVFIGKVKEVVDDKFYLGQGEGIQVVIFDVIQGLKSSEAGKGPISVIEQVGSSCSFGFEEGHTYVVFAYSDYTGVHLTDQCTRTKLLERFDAANLQRLEAISANYTGNSRDIGIVRMLVPKYHDMVNKINQLEEASASSRTLTIALITLLLVSAGLNFYLITNRK
ncbi:hypothetical protein C8N40_101271 [Pontibacter mucosus]|uniref:Tissue inhibitor of metalloproteinase n=1 Tax=Pontibacter mucosus TaxID=1649266 RepID=A0A2T5YSZ6_9BACT|nr:hypothetical protein [Pontibacter mucosus]PTX22447.1 hypothetical protein C8N40_101271 [Pontibacter mucosus]